MAALIENLFIKMALFICKFQQKSMAVFAVPYSICGNFNKK
jgi:hypothetical protein